MTLHWAQIAGSLALTQRRALAQDILAAERSADGDVRRFREDLRAFGYEGGVTFEGSETHFFDFAPQERPLLELVREVLGARVLVGYSANTPEVALSLVAQRFGMSFERARVRVGVSRGHLLEVTFTHPFDVPGDDDALGIASEYFLERLLGTDTYETWIGSVCVERRGRSSFRVLSEPGKTAENYELFEGVALIPRGISAITKELPESLLSLHRETWTALELSPHGSEVSCPQPGRTFVATSEPEAMKCALEGRPFSSRRFTRGEEIFVWCSFGAEGRRPGGDRAAHRVELEKSLNEAARSGAHVIGSGFGARADYFDLVVRAEPAILGELAQRITREHGAFTLGFYDDLWTEEAIAFPSP